MDLSEVKHLPKVDHTPAELDDDAKLLLKAAAIIERDGHAKGQLWHTSPITGPTCLMGALNRAHHGDSDHPYHGDEFSRISKIAGRVHGGISSSAVLWNNAAERTQDEVVARMRAVALGG